MMINLIVNGCWVSAEDRVRNTFRTFRSSRAAKMNGFLTNPLIVRSNAKGCARHGKKGSNNIQMSLHFHAGCGWIRNKIDSLALFRIDVISTSTLLSANQKKYEDQHHFNQIFLANEQRSQDCRNSLCIIYLVVVGKVFCSIVCLLFGVNLVLIENSANFSRNAENMHIHTHITLSLEARFLVAARCCYSGWLLLHHVAKVPKGLFALACEEREHRQASQPASTAHNTSKS